MRSVICVAWSSLLLLPTIANGQDKPWEVALAVHAYNSYYEETFTHRDNNPGDLQGNALTSAALHATITYRARQQMQLPFFLSLEAELPLAMKSGLEVGHEYKPEGTFLTQQQQVTQHELNGRLLLGFELLPFLQPYVGISRMNLTQRRTGELDGTDEGQLLPDNNQDYSEYINATFLDVGMQGVIPLNENADSRLCYDVGYKNPQTVFVSNTYFEPGIWGQGTTGYEYGGRMQLDLPLTLIDVFTNHNGYWTIGGTLERRHWNGDGTTGDNIFMRPHWPANTKTDAGGFVGVGLFF